MLIPLSFCVAGVFFMNLIFMILLVLFNRASYYISNNTKTLSISIWVKILEILGFYELPSPTTSEMVSTIPKQYSKARSQCHYSVGKNPSAYLQMLLDALVAPGTNTLYILRATGS